ncbi:MAG: DUF952 domain-containing protein [Proteobacteria bacterium]|nr:DUF952 domain-containing protein [Pseudomonadota bacterium]MBU6425025.1 DUF952 domain-containing protein [Rhodospirillales bacterium]
MTCQVAYKVLTQAQFDSLRNGSFAGAPVDIVDGYIHLSTAAQLDETLTKHFSGQDGLVIAAIPLAPLGDALKWEASRGGDLFPHFYGRLTMGMVGAYTALGHDSQGRALLPG